MTNLTDSTIDLSSITLFDRNGRKVGDYNLPRIFRGISFRINNRKLSVSSSQTSWICIEDIDDNFLLQDRMKLRFGHMTRGPEIVIRIMNNIIEFFHNDVSIYRSRGNKIEVGRGADSYVEGYEKFKLPVEQAILKTISRRHATIIYENNNWYYKNHPLQTETDIARERSTWLYLNRNIEYLISKGVRDNKIAIQIDNEPFLIQLNEQNIYVIYIEGNFYIIR